MTRFILAFLLLAAIPQMAHAEGGCEGYYHFYKDGKTESVPKKPFHHSHQDTSSARICVKQCQEDRMVRIQNQKDRYAKIQYDCHYNGKRIHNATQVIP